MCCAPHWRHGRHLPGTSSQPHIPALPLSPLTPPEEKHCACRQPSAAQALQHPHHLLPTALYRRPPTCTARTHYLAYAPCCTLPRWRTTATATPGLHLLALYFFSFAPRTRRNLADRRDCRRINSIPWQTRAGSFRAALTSERRQPGGIHGIRQCRIGGILRRVQQTSDLLARMPPRHMALLRR